jgi:hypothetical protein
MIVVMPMIWSIVAWEKVTGREPVLYIQTSTHKFNSSCFKKGVYVYFLLATGEEEASPTSAFFVYLPFVLQCSNHIICRGDGKIDCVTQLYSQMKSFFVRTSRIKF